MSRVIGLVAKTKSQHLYNDVKNINFRNSEANWTTNEEEMENFIDFLENIPSK